MCGLSDNLSGREGQKLRERDEENDEEMWVGFIHESHMNARGHSSCRQLATSAACLEARDYPHETIIHLWGLTSFLLLINLYIYIYIFLFYLYIFIKEQ